MYYPSDTLFFIFDIRLIQILKIYPPQYFMPKNTHYEVCDHLIFVPYLYSNRFLSFIHFHPDDSLNYLLKIYLVATINETA